MKLTLKRMLCRILVISTVLLPFQAGQASMIGTDQAISVATAQADRDLVSSFLSRSEATNELQSLGVSPQAAKDRVAAMTDSEVSYLAGQIQSLPAGADSSGVILLILIIAVIWWVWKR